MCRLAARTWVARLDPARCPSVCGPGNAHSRMMEVLLQLDADVMDGLFVLGNKMPQLASEIWVEAEVDDGV